MSCCSNRCTLLHHRNVQMLHLSVYTLFSPSRNNSLCLMTCLSSASVWSNKVALGEQSTIHCWRKANPLPNDSASMPVECPCPLCVFLLLLFNCACDLIQRLLFLVATNSDTCLTTILLPSYTKTDSFSWGEWLKDQGLALLPILIWFRSCWQLTLYLRLLKFWILVEANEFRMQKRRHFPSSDDQLHDTWSTIAFYCWGRWPP